jgi:hypothetical protein
MAPMVNRERRAMQAAGITAEVAQRPIRRADCVHGERPCPWIGCRMHLWGEVSEGGSLRAYRDVDPMDLRESCLLDVVAARGPLTLDEVGDLLNLKRERVRQNEEAALAKLGALGIPREGVEA